MFLSPLQLCFKNKKVTKDLSVNICDCSLNNLHINMCKIAALFNLNNSHLCYHFWALHGVAMKMQQSAAKHGCDFPESYCDWKIWQGQLFVQNWRLLNLNPVSAYYSP
jgi:hypothetical protein